LIVLIIFSPLSWSRVYSIVYIDYQVQSIYIIARISAINAGISAYFNIM